MSQELDNPHLHLKRLNYLSQNVSEVLHEIMSLLHMHLHQGPLPSEALPSDIQINLVEENLWINRIMIPLSTRPRTLLLLQAFYRNKSLSLSKEDIIEVVYGSQGTKSERFTSAQSASLTKLLSRTRNYLEQSLTHTYQRKQIDWLVFDSKTRRYKLYQFRDWDKSSPVAADH